MPHVTTDDGVSLYFEDVGSGSSIVFLHEFAGDYRSYEPQVRHFSRLFRCITFNARGFPPSDVPSDQSMYTQEIACRDTLAVMDHLSIDSAHLVGVSMGAFTALFLALSHPARVKSVVAAGCGFGADPTNRERIVRDIENAALAIERDGMESFAQTYTHGPARIQFKNKDERGWMALQKGLAEHSAAGSAMTLRGVQRDRPLLYDLKPAFETLSKPVLIVSGDEDNVCIDASVYLKRTLPAAGLSVMPRTGHTVNLEEPVVFNELCERFLHEVEVGRIGPRDERSLLDNAFGMAARKP
jgi:pimeloyl-ACP methyl ester carboxylesterase